MSSPRPAATPSNAEPLALRRFRPLRTLAFALVSALGFTLLTFALTAGHPGWRSAAGWARTLAVCLAFAVGIGFTIAGLYGLARRLLGRRTLTPLQMRLYYWGTPLLGLALAVPLISAVVEAIPGAEAGPQLRTTPLGAVAFMLLVTALFYGYFAIRARQWRAERRAAQAQLQLLQAQMEPHFLFNTLANVVGLMDADTPRAKAMLESFTDYLRASLISLRAPEHALGAELDLVEAYLRVAQVRMDDRLRFRIDVPAELRAARVPALSLQPLVENAVVHGLEPAIAGGQITISARRLGHLIELRVVDDGVGLDAAPRVAARGHGSALANIRERLQQIADAGAALRVEPAVPHGVQAVLTLPFTETP
ncbi:MAG TPA: histidine kinase [Burkholderiaceae bacterium]|nr:histidine kinase [Burkholderiaceae bacterium]